jgi:hypothetical protein
VLSLVLSIGACDIVLAWLGQHNLALYYVCNVVIFLAITLLYGNLKPLARRNLNIVGLLFWAGILILVASRLIGQEWAAP